MIPLTLAEYKRLRASLPRGPFGPIWPAELPLAVLIVPEPAVDIPPALVTAAADDAATRRN